MNSTLLEEMIELKKLEQLLIEDKYSRHNIREHILKDIAYGLEKPLQTAVQALTLYLEGNYYESKNRRLEQLRDKPVLQIITEICILVLPLEGAQPIQGVVGQLATYFKYDDLFDGIKTAAEIVAVVCKSNLYDIIPANSSETGSLMIKSNYSLEPETLNYIQETKYLPPMICKPEKVFHNNMDGYLTRQKSVILGKGNHHNMHLALDVINNLNEIELCLDTFMLEYEEVTTKPLDTYQKITQHSDLVSSSTKVYNDLIEQGNHFYLTWKYDSRGRVYSQGFHVNLQSTSYKKSIINLSKKELIQ